MFFIIHQIAQTLTVLPSIRKLLDIVELAKDMNIFSYFAGKEHIKTKHQVFHNIAQTLFVFSNCTNNIIRSIVAHDESITVFFDSYMQHPGYKSFFFPLPQF